MEESSWDFKKTFEKVKIKYSLPDFNRLCEDFDLEKVLDKETSFILRDIRRTMNEKISAYLHLMENLINPNSPPMFLLNAIKKFNSDERDTIKDLYKKLSLIQVKVMKLDTIYSEKEEAEFIKSTYSEWQEYKKVIFKLISSFDSKFSDNNSSVERGYYG